MTERRRTSCCVCGLDDQRALVDVPLAGRTTASLCGSHALMHSRLRSPAQSEAELVALLREKRGRRDRRRPGDELGIALTQAFAEERRAADSRRQD